MLEMLGFEGIRTLRRTSMGLFRLIKEPIMPDNHSKPNFITLLGIDPLMEEYSNSSTVTKLWSNEVFGGPVYKPIRGAKTGIGGELEMT